MGGGHVGLAHMSQHWPWFQSVLFAAPVSAQDFCGDPRWHELLASVND